MAGKRLSKAYTTGQLFRKSNVLTLSMRRRKNTVVELTEPSEILFEFRTADWTLAVFNGTLRIRAHPRTAGW
jgi:hypothetical protein